MDEKIQTVPASPTAAEVSVDVARLGEGLRPADRAVALMALADALKAEIEDAKAEALRLADLTGAKSFRTPMGSLSITVKPAPVGVDPAKLLIWAKEHDPDLVETVEQVKPWAVKQVSDRLRVVAGSVYDGADLVGREVSEVDGLLVCADGEVVEPAPYAILGSQPAPYASWPSSREKKHALAAAREFVRGKSAALAAGVVEAGR